MNKNNLVVEKCIGNIKDRTDGVFNDLKAFVYIRNNNLQHNKGENKENIGGGNIVTVLSLFACLNFLAKTYYCTMRTDKFNTDDGTSKDETGAFIHFMKFIQKSGLDLGLSPNGEVLRVVWHGFRDWSVHRLTAQPGKRVINFTFEIDEKNTIAESFEYAKRHKAFECASNDRNWMVNCDVLLANLPKIITLTIDHIKNSSDIDSDLLLKVVGVEYP